MSCRLKNFHNVLSLKLSRTCGASLGQCTAVYLQQQQHLSDKKYPPEGVENARNSAVPCNRQFSSLSGLTFFEVLINGHLPVIPAFLNPTDISFCLEVIVFLIIFSHKLLSVGYSPKSCITDRSVH